MVVAVSTRLVLIRSYIEFHEDGLSAIPIRDIRRIESSTDWQQFQTHMMREEGMIPPPAISDQFPIACYEDLLRSLRKSNRNVIIECESRSGRGEDEFYIGRIMGCGREYVSLLHFGAEGEWDEEPTAIKYRQITNVQFDTPYITLYSKYLPPLE